MKNQVLKNANGIVLLLQMSLVISLAAQSSPSREYQVKAAFIFNFTQFVEWPPSSLPDDQSPLVIGVLGVNPFGTYLEKTIAGEKTNNHPLVVQYFTAADEIKICHILFINSAHEKAVADLKGKSILTVSDSRDFLVEGGMIRFFTRKNKLQLEVNLEAVKAADLNISSKLLRLADIFIPNKK